MSLALKRFPFAMTRSDRALAWTFTAFALLIVLTALMAPNRSEIPHSTIWLLAFLSPWIVIPRLRASEGVDMLHPYVVGAGVGVIGAALLAFVQTVVLNIARAEGGAGNPAVFAAMVLCLLGVGALNIAAPARSRPWLAIAAVVAGLVALTMSLTRGVGLALVPVLILVAIYAPARWRAVIVSRTGLLLAAGAAVALYAVQKRLDARWNETVTEIYRMMAEGHGTRGIGERLRLWQAGWDTFVASPLWGHGIQNRMASLAPELAKDGQPIYGFTHAHNGLLSFALDGGILTLAALVAVLCVPVVIAWRAPRDANYRLRLFLALILTTAYTGSGMTQILFKHDIMDAFFVFCAILIAASIPGDGLPARQRRSST